MDGSSGSGAGGAGGVGDGVDMGADAGVDVVVGAGVVVFGSCEVEQAVKSAAHSSRRLAEARRI